MPGTTPIYALRFQLSTDPPNGATLGQNLANDVEVQLDRIDNPPVGKMVGAGTAQVFVSGTTAVVDFAGSQINIGGMNDLTNNWFNVITPGIYLAIGSIRWADPAPATSGYRALALGLNGIERKQVNQEANSSFGVNTSQDVAVVLSLVAGDKITLRGLQTQGTDLAVEYSLVDSVSLSLHFISPL